MTAAAELDAATARHLALAAQGLTSPRPVSDSADAAPIGTAPLRALVQRLGAVQLDSVNVLTRSHYLPAWSRLGAYAPEALDALAGAAPRALFEYWGHEASLLPVELQPLLRWRMARAASDAWGNIRAVRHQRALLARVLDFIGERGPTGVADLELAAPRKRRGGWWGWSDGKLALEWLFWSGQLTSAGRRRFERLYDLPERVLPPEILAAPTPSEPTAQRLLVERAARALGVATEADLRDYFRLPLAAARAAIAALIEEAVLVPVRVPGWGKPAFAHAQALPQATTEARRHHEQGALLSPFDSLIWNRERTERVFGMRVRLEVYVPAPRRVHGYYVLPFLLGEELVARVDLKADRAAGVLRVAAAHLEPAQLARRAEIAAALARELRGLAGWQGLADVASTRRGNLAAALGAELRPRRPRAARPTRPTRR